MTPTWSTIPVAFLTGTACRGSRWNLRSRICKLQPTWRHSIHDSRVAQDRISQSTRMGRSIGPGMNRPEPTVNFLTAICTRLHSLGTHPVENCDSTSMVCSPNPSSRGLRQTPMVAARSCWDKTKTAARSLGSIPHNISRARFMAFEFGTTFVPIRTSPITTTTNSISRLPKPPQRDCWPTGNSTVLSPVKSLTLPTATC